MSKRTILLMCAIAGFAIIAFIAFTMWFEPATRMAKWERQIIPKLAAAQSQEELQQIVKPLGVFVLRGDGTWIAICYKDTHSGGISSRAIARDSGGGWYRSRYHYCGALKYFQTWVDSQVDPENAERSREEAARMSFEENDFRTIFHAKNLTEAREELLKLHFMPMKR